MRLDIRNAREACVGVIFLALGAFVLVVAHDYPMGTATQMGPGYFPTLLALLLCALGVLAVVQAIRTRRPVAIGPWPLVPLAFVIAGVLVFAALIGDHGLALAVTAVVLFGCYERLLRRPVEVVVIALAMVAVTDVIFIQGIQLPIDLW